MSDVKTIIEYVRNLGDPDIAVHSQRYFKTGKGEYGEGDVFIGIRVPVLRKAAKKFLETSLEEVVILLHSKYHEIRLLALLIMVYKFQKAKTSETEKSDIFNLYIENTDYINNWDLVDTSAHKIVGAWLEDKDRSLLYELVNSTNLWERRIAIISTFRFIDNGGFEDSLSLAEKLLQDKEDLIHKAVGWVLREVWKNNPELGEAFLNQHYKEMPRTMLRYVIERMPKEQRQAYLRGHV